MSNALISKLVTCIIKLKKITITLTVKKPQLRHSHMWVTNCFEIDCGSDVNITLVKLSHP